MRFERLGRRLAIVGATLLAAGIGVGGSASPRAASRRRAASPAPLAAA